MWGRRPWRSAGRSWPRCPGPARCVTRARPTSPSFTWGWTASPGRFPPSRRRALARSGAGKLPWSAGRPGWPGSSASRPRFREESEGGQSPPPRKAMSGHSRWSQIKRKKGKADQQRGKLFTKLIREITVAARTGGGDLKINMRLKGALEAAKAASMPADNIKRAIQKGTGELPGETYEEVTYEGYGPGGVALMIRVLTDNKNRTAPEIRHVFEKNGGNLGQVGCVAWMFERKGVIQVDAERIGEDELLGPVLDAGASDMRRVEKVYEITTTPDEMESVRRALEERKVPVLEAEVSMVPLSTVRAEGKDAHAVLRLVEALEEQDDVQAVYANYDIPDEIIDAITAA